MTRQQRLDRTMTPSPVKDFVLDRFKERGEKLSNFIAASDYTPASVHHVLNGWVASPRIRHDMARFLRYETWKELMEDFENTQEDVDCE